MSTNFNQKTIQFKSRERHRDHTIGIAATTGSLLSPGSCDKTSHRPDPLPAVSSGPESAFLSPTPLPRDWDFVWFNKLMIYNSFIFPCLHFSKVSHYHAWIVIVSAALGFPRGDARARCTCMVPPAYIGWSWGIHVAGSRGCHGHPGRSQQWLC